jgi:KDO2-lipid IV(A) lauroyltransferase
VVNFLGHLSQVAPGAAVFARRLSCPILPAVTVRMDNSRYRVIIGDRIPLCSSGDRDADQRANMERFLEAVGPHILQHPGQWTWFHKMWKVRPEALPSLNHRLTQIHTDNC